MFSCKHVLCLQTQFRITAENCKSMDYTLNVYGIAKCGHYKQTNDPLVPS